MIANRLLFNTLILSFGVFLPQLASFVTIPLYTSVLSHEEYGFYDFINTVIYVLTIVSILQIHYSVFRFLIDVRGTGFEKKYISNAIIFELSLSIVVSVAFYFWLYTLTSLMKFLLSGYLFLNLQLTVIGNITRGLGKNIVYAISAIIQSFSNLLFVYVFLINNNFGLIGIFLSINISLLLSLLFQIFSCRLWTYINFSLYDMKLLKEMIHYSLPMVPNAVSVWIINAFDKIIINIFLGLSYNGLFAAALKIPSIFTIAYSAFNLAWQESASIKSNDIDSASYYDKVFSALLDFLFGCILLLISFSPILFPLFIKGDYSLSYDQLPILYIGVFFSCISSFLGGIYIANMDSKTIGITSIWGAVINIIINLSLIKFIGLYAASLSTVISYFILICCRAYGLKKRGWIKFDYKKKRLFFCFVLLLISCVLCYLKCLFFDIINIIVGVVSFITLNHKMIMGMIKSIKKKFNISA